ncbi:MULTISPECIES: hypothetical protein [unclassified Nodularia (in: cyanobacteria)]|nr:MULTISPECIES: hypothetical protein [unclassified Nodularia (in: cyanobacteria)]MBE9200265.1 hypothetical protein [Nodularia sp. LEGE 06071]MCC2693408.1 hypothetical protein [Nodularia sp. LEGE 04288]
MPRIASSPTFAAIESIDARLGDQTRYQRWEAGLIVAPYLICRVGVA